MVKGWHEVWSETMDRFPPGTLVEVCKGREWKLARIGVANSSCYFESGFIPIQFPGEGAGNQSLAYPTCVRAADAVARLADIAND